MTMGIPPWKERALDGEKVFMMWQRMGTLNLVLNQLIKEGFSSPRTGKPISRAAIAMSAWRWAARNPDLSFEKMQTEQKAKGVVVSRDEWDAQLIIHARQFLTSSGYVKFIEKNGLEEKARSV